MFFDEQIPPQALVKTQELVSGADVVVVAAGAWLPKLMPSYAGRVTPSRQVVAYLDLPDEEMEELTGILRYL